ncbi:uncharacterized protein BXZ73DRAFT_7862, partial [Epithele typhae]|uniref:uncharacterized protein n=1 Tax=Epithele typhae TaxID=378194 RepID=UPI002008B05E
MESSASESPSESPIDIDVQSHTSHSARSSFSDHTRSKARRSKDGTVNGSMRDVARVLVARERETIELKRALYTLNQQFEAERQRADSAEAKTREVLALFKSTNDAKIVAETEAARANEGLRLYKLQYENAQNEMRRAQSLLNDLETQRVDAEAAAAKARSMARKLREEKITMKAKEEGRRQGLEEGIAQGQIIGYEAGRAAGYDRPASEQEFVPEPYEDTRNREYQTSRLSRPSMSEDSLQEAMTDYTQPVDTMLSMPPPVATPA